MFRAGYSRNPQNDNMIGSRMRNFPVNVQINDVAAGGQQRSRRSGNFSDGYPLLPILDINPPHARRAGRRHDHDQRVGTVHARRHHDVQRVGAESAARTTSRRRSGYVGNRQTRYRAETRTSTTARSAAGDASQPFNQPGLANNFRTTAALNVVRPLGHVKYDSLQASVNRRMTNGLARHVRLHLRARAPTGGPAALRFPEYWGLNKGTQGGNTPHKFDVSVIYELPFGQGKKYANGDGRDAEDRRRVAGEQRISRPSPARRSPSPRAAASLNAPGSPSCADQVKEPEILWGIGPNTPYFDPTAFKPVTDARFGNGGIQHHARAGICQPGSELVPHLRGVESARNLQFRLEVFNLTNTPHFQNPGRPNVSNASVQR